MPTAQHGRLTGRAVAACAAVLTLGAGALAGCGLGDDSDTPPQLGAKGDDDSAREKLGFPASATKNTIRVGGGDATADAAGVANAIYPARSDRTRPNAVVLVDKDDWQAGVTGGVLSGNPIRAPLLLTDGEDLPAATEETIDRLDPRGSDLSKDAQVIRIGEDTAEPGGRKTAVIKGKDQYERAAAVDRFISSAKGKPSPNVIVASGEEADYALPAGPLAARSGDSVLLVPKDSVPPATAKALREHEKPNIFILGPANVISEKVERELRKLGTVRRVAGAGPVANAVAFARYESGSFGWGITVPGYNLTLANADRPLDAAAAAALATNGVFAPLLLTDDAKRLPRPVESYLRDIQPGFQGDPGQAVYNRVWILGDDEAISVDQQALIDELTELVPVQVGSP
ncbi:MAG: cell wall-binding repeat-containing protein [Thermoleophilaceae bacterium]